MPLARGVLLVALCCYCLAVFASAEDSDQDWDLFAIDRQHSVGLRVGHSDSTNWGISANLMLPAATELHVDYLRSDFDLPQSKEKLANYSIQFTTDPLAVWSAQLIYERSGKASSLQTEDIGFGLQHRREHWLAGVRWLHGKAELQTNPIAVNAQPRRFKLDRNAIELQFSAFRDNWQGSIRMLDYRYERRIRLNPNSLLLLRRLGLNTFQQVFGLLDWSASLEVGYQKHKHFWRIGYSQHELELTGESGQIPYLGWDYHLSERVTMGFLGAVGLRDSEHYGELSLSYQF